MEQIKVRAYSSKSGMWSWEKLKGNNPEPHPISALYSHDGWWVMLYSGLYDKNDVEICQGDIVSRFGDTQRSVVEFRAGCFMTVRQLSGASEPDYDILCNDLSVTTVIGNIHENPELLK